MLVQMKFFMHLITKVRNSVVVLLLLSSDKEKDSILYKQIEPLVDNIIKL